MQSFTNHLISEFQKDFTKKFKNILSNSIQKKLAFMGIHFNNETEFLLFAENRITRVIDEDRSVFYLDYVDDENCGALLGSYGNDVDYNWNKDHTMITADWKVFS